MNEQPNKNFPENDPNRESRELPETENPHKAAGPESGIAARFRESSIVRPPRKLPNAQRRSREFLTCDEVSKLQDAAGKLGRHGHRDATMILLAFRHGLRVSELVALRWDQIDLKQGVLHVRRRKNGSPSTHPLSGPELRALRRLEREYNAGRYVFVTERGGPLTDATVRKFVARAGIAAGLPFPIHPHMFRHSVGFKLANDGQDTRAIQHYLGHKNITHTVRYTELSPERFKDFWPD
jgi:type 1 fimbriae regulatory protein FimE